MTVPPVDDGGAPLPHRVLVADDVADERFLVRRTLERTGSFEVVAEAIDGADAVRLAAETRPALALLDLAMPNMDGLQALDRIRQVSPETVVVVLSSFGRQRMAPTVRDAGAAGYLEKGLEPEHLVEGLLGILADAHQPHAADPTAQPGEQLARTVLNGVLSAPAAARRFVDEALDSWGLDHLSDTAKLLTSELVTNAVTHAESDLELTLLLRGGFLRVEVYDRADSDPHQRNASDDATGGRGLALVDALATEWGTDDAGQGKVVWFEVAQDADGL